MRQIVAFVEGETLRYFVSDDGGQEIRQIAEMVNPGLDVRDVLQLGDMLSHALHLNGDAPAPAETEREKRNRKAREAYHRNKDRATGAAAKRPPLPPEQRRPPGRLPGIPHERRHSVTIEQIIDVIRQHPEGCRPVDIAEAVGVTPGFSLSEMRQVIDNRLRVYFERCERRGEQPAIRRVASDDARPTATMYPER